MKKSYCDRCSQESGEGIDISEANLYLLGFQNKEHTDRVRTDLSVTGRDICAPCAEKLSSLVKQFFEDKKYASPENEPEAGKISRHRPHKPFPTD